jgi:hypothetical protein
LEAGVIPDDGLDASLGLTDSPPFFVLNAGMALYLFILW